MRHPPDDADPEAVVPTVGGLVTALTMTAAFGGLALGVENWWIAFPVGFGAVMPLAMGVARVLATRGDDSEPSDAHEGDRSREGAPDGETSLGTLRERYARGEIDEVEFERRVETVLETDPEAGGR